MQIFLQRSFYSTNWGAGVRSSFCAPGAFLCSRKKVASAGCNKLFIPWPFFSLSPSLSVSLSLSLHHRYLSNQQLTLEYVRTRTSYMVGYNLLLLLQKKKKSTF